MDAVSDESDTTNNCSTPVAVAVGEAPAPDLVVDTAMVSDSAPAAGASFTLSAAVRNQGSGPSASTTLRYYQSTDSAISSSDTPVGTGPVGGLPASGSSTESITLTAPDTPGTYHYGACVDAVSDESDTTNNCSTPVAVAVGEAPAPDLVVDTAMVSDSAPAAAASFTLSAAVRNQGSGPSASTTLRYYQSTDSAISSSDTTVGTGPVGGLPASASSPQSVSLTAPSTPGTYYYGACVDAVSDESDTTNNCSTAVAVAVGEASATMRASRSLSQTSVNAGGAVEVTIIAAGYGAFGQVVETLPAGFDYVTSSLSDDSVEAEERRVAFTLFGETSFTYSLTAPSAAGSYPFSGVLRNFDGVEVTVGGTLSVTVTVGSLPSVSVLRTAGSEDTKVRPGSPISLTSTFSVPVSGFTRDDINVANGTVSNFAGSGAVYTFDVTPDGIGEVTVDIAAGVARDADGNGNEAASRFSLGFTYDDDGSGGISRDEVIAAIRDYFSGMINRGQTIAVIRLYFSPPTAAKPGPPTGLTASGNGQTQIDLRWTAPARDGGAAITGYKIEFSEDSTFWNDLESDTGSTATTYSHTGLGAGSTWHYRVAAINSAGTGPVSNIATGTTDSSSNREPDLVVDEPTVSDSTPAAGASFTLSATVRNRGSGSSASTTLRYYRSSDSTIAPSDTPVGTASVGGLNASETSAETIRLTAPDTPGTYHYGACVDAVAGETDPGNNCSAAVTVAVGAAPAPDLVVDPPSVSDSTPDAGASFTLNATVRNQGNGAAGFTTLHYYRSTDSTITAADTQVGTDDLVLYLNALASTDKWTDLTAPETPGTYYYGACVDAVRDESDTTNNCSTAVTVAVGAAPAPDLVVDPPAVDDGTPEAGAAFNLSATVRNQGSGSSASTTLRYYQSTDSAISSSDTPVGTGSVGGLPASASSTESITLTAPDTPGTYHYGACVDAVAGETDPGNNCSAAVTVAVGAAPAPDLVVDSPAVDDGTPDAGAAFTLSATVRNQGSGSSESTTLRYYRSSDSAITSADTPAGTDSVGGLDASGTSAESITMTAPDTPGTYHYGACVDAVAGETDSGNNCSAAVTVAVGAAPAPDLVVDPPSVDGTPDAGEAFTLSATVRNRGDEASAPTTLRYYRSSDSAITSADTASGDRRRGRTERLGNQRWVHHPDRSRHSRHLPLRRLCGCGSGGERSWEQLLHHGDGVSR